MAWKFERVAGPYEGPAGGVVRDGDAVVFSTIDEGKLWGFDPKSKKFTEVRRYTNRVNGLARGPNGELYGAQEGGRRLVEFTPDGRVMPVDALLDGKYHNQPSVVSSADSSTARGDTVSKVMRVATQARRSLRSRRSTEQWSRNGKIAGPNGMMAWRGSVK